jgi:hypothetical protein
MKSKELNLLLINAFPEIRCDYNQEISWQEGDDTGSHIVYGDVFSPWIVSIFQNNDEDKLYRVFNFIESILTLNDDYGNEVIIQSVLESLHHNHPYSEIDKFMKPRTKNLYNKLSSGEQLK